MTHRLEAGVMTAAMCTWDAGAMYDCAPACSQPATHVVRYRKDSYPIGRPYFEALACRRHIRPMEGYAESGLIETVELRGEQNHG